jgi:hypothetical protein
VFPRGGLRSGHNVDPRFGLLGRGGLFIPTPVRRGQLRGRALGSVQTLRQVRQDNRKLEITFSS